MGLSIWRLRQLEALELQELQRIFAWHLGGPAPTEKRGWRGRGGQISRRNWLPVRMHEAKVGSPKHL